MLEKAFQDVYTKFKLHFYQNVFQRFATREATLTTVESFCMEGIMAMGEPTIAEFSRMMQISTPNAAYKINNLVKKGYVEKIRSEVDGRQVFVKLTKMGRKVNAGHLYFHENMVRNVSGDMSEEEKEILVRAMKNLNKFFKRKLETRNE